MGSDQRELVLVVTRSSTFTLKGRALDVRQVVRELGVRYALQGSVRTAGRRIRVTGQLIDSETGNHIWAERYDRELGDVFAVQDEITARVVATVEPRLYDAEGLRVRTRPPESIDAWGLVAQAMSLINRVGRRDNEQARVLLARAIAIDPHYVRAQAVLAWAIW